MRPEVNSNRFETSSRFEKGFYLHGDFTAATFWTIVRFYGTCVNVNFEINANLIDGKPMLQYWLFFNNSSNTHAS